MTDLMPERAMTPTKVSPVRGRAIEAFESIAPRPRRSQGAGLIALVFLLICLGMLGLNWNRVVNYLHPASSALPSKSGIGPVNKQMLNPAPPSVPPADKPVTQAAPRPLSDCLGSGAAIDEEVLRCRFGEVPRAKAAIAPAQGMVSADYLARFHTAQGGGAKTARTVAVETYSITSWDGQSGYLATWQVNGNDIDHSSVCSNYPRGSIDYRECRKGAKRWFKDQCIKNSDADARLRYCSAASSFSPM